MRRFLIAFICLSTLAMAQNVVAGTPAPAAQGVWATAGLVGSQTDSSARQRVGGETPELATMLLLVVGLAGLAAVGRRRDDADDAGL